MPCLLSGTRLVALADFKLTLGTCSNPPPPNHGAVLLDQIWLDGTPGEPMNAIISSNSSSQVLCPEGFLRYATYVVPNPNLSSTSPTPALILYRRDLLLTLASYPSFVSIFVYRHPQLDQLWRLVSGQHERH